ncbi:MAG: zinc-ribbon domain-containing protein [Clostridia bacterium]|nr:zinc-ribbon domain-containing protein [Clostridia bacterium]
MEQNRHKTARYKVISDTGGVRFKFYCEASGAAVCITKQCYPAETEEELLQAWETEGKQQFNRCHKCGRWICNAMYNADTLECVDCSPWEEHPRYCPHCGSKVKSADVFCNRCGVRLMYGGDADDEAV